MSNFGASTASDLAYMALVYYLREPMLSQTTQKKPLLNWLRRNSETFPSGNLQVSVPVQVTFMSDTSTFLQGYSGDESITFSTAANTLRAAYTWKEVQCSLAINWTELKIDGITITDNNTTSDHGSALTRLTSILKNRMADFTESQARAFNSMYWKDGTQDSKQVAGLPALLPDTNTSGTVGGLTLNSTSGWYPPHRVNLALPTSAENSSLIHSLNDELIQLRRYGGSPDVAFCGSDFLRALRIECVAKGYFSMTGFANARATNIGISGISIEGLGAFVYDPTMDDLGMSKRCYIMDSSKLKLMPMVGEDMKVLNPERPYNYMVFLKTVTFTGVMVARQLNAHGVYSI